MLSDRNGYSILVVGEIGEHVEPFPFCFRDKIGGHDGAVDVPLKIAVMRAPELPICRIVTSFSGSKPPSLSARLVWKWEPEPKRLTATFLPFSCLNEVIDGAARYTWLNRLAITATMRTSAPRNFANMASEPCDNETSKVPAISAWLSNEPLLT